SPVEPPDTEPRSSSNTSCPRSCKKNAVAAPQMPAPTTTTSADTKAFGERVVGIEHVLPHAGHPGAPGDLGDHPAPSADVDLLDQPAGEPRPDHRLVHERRVELQLAARPQLSHPRAGSRPTRRPVEPARVDRRR